MSDETVFVRSDDRSDAICGRCYATEPDTDTGGTER